MKGLFLKDAALYLRLYGKTLILLLIVFSAVGAAVPGFSISLGWFLPFYGIFLSQAELNSRWDLYACSLPVSRSQIVSARFLLILALLAVGSVFSLISGFFGMIFSSFSLSEVLATSLMGTLSSLPLCGIALWFNYRFGTSKSRILLTLVCLLPFGLGMLFHFAGGQDSMAGAMLWLEQNFLWAILSFIAACIFVFALSWLLSIRCCKKMEF